jgi:hypothetical protein
MQWHRGCSVVIPEVDEKQMSSHRIFTALLILSASSYACSVNNGAPSDNGGQDVIQAPAPPVAPPAKSDPAPAVRTGPGADATDTRTPELGADITILKTSKMTMAEGLAESEKLHGPATESKFELNDDGKLSLSVYPVGKGITTDPENNEFQEIFGDPTVKPWATTLEIFKAGDFEHLTRSTRDLTLVQLSRVTLAQAVATASKSGFVYWAIPTIEKGRAGYGVYTLSGTSSQYQFIDGDGSRGSTVASKLVDLGTGPGPGASDTRTPKLPDLSALATSKISMAQGLEQMEAKYGPAIEAKFEINDDGNLDLSIYPVGKGIKTDPENNEFQELAGSPTGEAFAPSLTVFKADDFEHITRSTRDLTLVQTAGLTLRQAVAAAQAASPGGFVYWAIPTIRDTRAGYGVYVYGADNKAHYYFVS